jgi:hypothetical protein
MPASNTPDAAASIHTFTAESLLSTPLPGPTQYVIDKMLRSNTPRPNLIAGLPRAGKSTLMTQMAVCVGNGTPFWNRATQRGHVVIWKSEDYPAETRAQFEKAGMVGGPDGTKVSFIFGLMLPAGTDKNETLRAELSKHPDTVLVIIETLPLYTGNPALNEANDIVAAFEKFHSEVMAHPNPAYVFLHQYNKRGKDNKGMGRSMERINGSIFLTAGAATTIYLDQVSDEDKRRVVHTEGRGDGDLEIDPTFLVFERCTNTSTLGGLVVEERDFKKKQDEAKAGLNVAKRIETALTEHPGIAKNDLYAVLREAGLQMRREALKEAVNRYIDLGWVTVTKAGKFERLTWKGVTYSATPDNAAENLGLQNEEATTPETEAGTIEESPSFGTTFAIRKHICEALGVSEEKRIGAWEVVVQNLLMAGHAPQHIAEVFDYFRSEGKNDAALRVVPSSFEKKFSEIAARMAERMVAQ